MSSDVVISVKGVKKDFKLPHEKTTSIKGGVVNMFKKRDKRVETQHALKGVSFDIHEGEFFGILGRNGSGKSTLLKILAEIYQPTAGSVSVRGKLVPFIELGVGFNPELTGRENVYLNGALLGFSKKEIDDRYHDIVAFAELEDFMDQKLKNYSSGMQVRLAFSVATRAEADILLVDEVLAVGDADFQRKCFAYFRSLKKTGKTVVFVTHDMGAVKEYCDRAILINDGKITHNDKPEIVTDEYLKLFNQASDEEAPVTTKKNNRWGNGLARVTGVTARSGHDEIFVDVKIKAGKQDLDSLLVDVKIINSKDEMIAGIGSYNAGAGANKNLSIAANETISLAFTAKSVMGGGPYTINVTAYARDNITIYDHISGVAKIHIPGEPAYYPVVLPGSVEVINE